MAVLEAHGAHQNLVDELLEEVATYNPEVDRELLTRAFRFAAAAHEGQQRRSGEAFIHHPWGVAKICAQLRSCTTSSRTRAPSSTRCAPSSATRSRGSSMASRS